MFFKFIFNNNIIDRYLELVNAMRNEKEIKERIKICENTKQFISKDEQKRIEGEIKALRWVLGEGP